MNAASRGGTPTTVKRTVRLGRRPNNHYRVREYLTEREIERLIKAAGSNRYGHRDATMILLAFRHGLRASELASLRWEQVDLVHARLHVSRLKNGIPSVHPLTGSELRALRRLQREQTPGRYVFMSERGAPMSAVGFRRMVTRLGKAAKSHLACTRTCFDTPAGSNLPTMATTRARSSTTSGIRTSNTPFATPSCPPTGFGTFGRIDFRTAV
jgi:integrase